MSTFFIATTNIRHSGEIIKKDSIISGEHGTFGELVSDGTLREIVGASSFEEAEEILAKETVNENDTEANIEVAPKDTWAPTPEPTEEVTEPEVTDDTLPTDGVVTDPATVTSTEEKKENKGILGNIFGKKEEAKVETPLAPDNL